jgi:hypothetical protein
MPDGVAPRYALAFLRPRSGALERIQAVRLPLPPLMDVQVPRAARALPLAVDRRAIPVSVSL